MDRSGGQPRRNVYVNPNYRPQKVTTLAPRPYRQPAPLPAPRLNEKKDVIIGGVAFESSGRTLVRKDCTPFFYGLSMHGTETVEHDLLRLTVAVTRPAPTVTKPPSFASAHAARFTAPQAPPSGRVYKPKTPRRGRPMNHNMTLTNNRAPKGCVYFTALHVCVVFVDLSGIVFVVVNMWTSHALGLTLQVSEPLFS